MQSLPVQSRIIKTVYFSPENGRLLIRFKNGEERHFADVPEVVVKTLVQAPSPGQYYLDVIRKQFPRLAA